MFVSNHLQIGAIAVIFITLHGRASQHPYEIPALNGGLTVHSNSTYSAHIPCWIHNLAFIGMIGTGMFQETTVMQYQRKRSLEVPQKLVHILLARNKAVCLLRH
jgi:hypothetical protein